MSFAFRPAARENVALLIGLAGGTGSGKTYSAMRLAKGLAGDKTFVVIDTEAGRAKHYADDFQFDHGDLGAPFRPEAYADAIKAADDAGYPVIVVDSFSHEHAGEGGLLDWHEEEYERLGGRDSVKMTAWIKPKMAHRKMVSRLLQVRAHLIICLRAQESVEIVKVDGKTVVRPKQSLIGLDGWQPISERNLPYEFTASFLMTADRPGVPKPIKLPANLQPFVPLTEPLTEETGRALARWASGSAGDPTAVDGAHTPPVSQAPTDGAKPASPADQMPSGAPPSSPASEGTPLFATEKQRKLMFAKSKEAGLDEAGLKAIIREHTGQESSAAITRDVFEAILRAIEDATVTA